MLGLHLIKRCLENTLFFAQAKHTLGLAHIASIFFYSHKSRRTLPSSSNPFLSPSQFRPSNTTSRSEKVAAAAYTRKNITASRLQQPHSLAIAHHHWLFEAEYRIMGRKIGGLFFNPKKRRIAAKPCMQEMISFLSCLSQNQMNDERCLHSKELLKTCLDDEVSDDAIFVYYYCIIGL